MVTMHKPWLVCLFAGVLLFHPTAFAADMSGWSHFALLEIQGSSNYKAVFLTDEVYTQASPGLADLRIIDNSDRQVPYYLQAGNMLREQAETSWNSRATRSYKINEDGYFDYAVAAQPGIDPTVNKMVFSSLPNRNFVRQIEVYGSYDNVQWQYVCTGQIYRVDGRVRNELFLDGVQRFTYYRIKMLDNSNDLTPGEIKLAYTERRLDWNRYERSFSPPYEVKNEQRETIITLQNPNKLHMKKIIFDVGDNFQRNYSLYEESRSSLPLQSGEIYNLQFAGVNITNQEIVLRKQLTANNVVVKINNRDDRPLQIKNIHAEYFVHKLVFQDLGDGPYRLYFGNAKAEKASYELALLRNFIEKEPQDSCLLRASQENKRSTKPWSAIPDSYLLNGAIVFVSLILVFILVPKLSSRK